MSNSIFHQQQNSETDTIVISRLWTRSLKQLTADACEMGPLQPFTNKCAGSSASECGSNLHTQSIIDLTEYILIFQVRDDIQLILRILHDLCTSNPNPVQERPFILIIACAYINAVANVNLDEIEGFGMLLHMICELCGALNLILEARPGGMGLYWPGLEAAFDYIRNHGCKDEGIDSAAPAYSASELTHNKDAINNV